MSTTEMLERDDSQGRRGAQDPTTDDDARWRAVVERDRQWDGEVVYAVRSTGIFCRPSCPSRRPRRERVAFFPTAAAAAAAGFRACRRCHPNSVGGTEAERAVERTRAHIAASLDEPLTLAALAPVAGMSPHHLQRTFRRIVGVSPKQYVDALRVELFKSRLQRGGTVSRAAYDAGFGSGAAAYARADALAMTPGRYRRGGRGTTISFVTAASPQGYVLVAGTPRGVAAVALADDEAVLAAELRAEYPQATLVSGRAIPSTLRPQLAMWLAATLSALGGEPTRAVPLDLPGTPFQRRVWTALRTIPRGSTQSYRQVAESMGAVGAERAVGRACAANPAAVLIPCHRVVRSDGGLGGYRWGVARKAELLRRERNGHP